MSDVAVCPTNAELVEAMRPAYDKYLPGIFAFLREKMLDAAREGEDSSCMFYIYELPLPPRIQCPKDEDDIKVWCDTSQDFFDTFYKPRIEEWLKEPVSVDWSSIPINGSAIIVWELEEAAEEE